MLGGTLVAKRAVLAGPMPVHPGLPGLVVAVQTVGVIGVATRPLVTGGAVDAALRVSKLPRRSGSVAQQAVASRLVLGGVTPLAAGLREIVALRAANGDVPGDVRCARSRRGERVRRERRGGTALVHVGRLKRRRRHRVPRVRVAALTGALSCVLAVRESGSRGLGHARVAPETPVIRYVGCDLTGKQSVAQEVGAHLAKCDELVAEAGGQAGSDVTLDTRDVCVGPAGPRVHIRHHLVARAAERRAIGVERCGHEDARKHDQPGGHPQDDPTPRVSGARLAHPAAEASCGLLLGLLEVLVIHGCVSQSRPASMFPLRSLGPAAHGQGARLTPLPRVGRMPRWRRMVPGGAPGLQNQRGA